MPLKNIALCEQTHPFTGRNMSWLLHARAEKYPDKNFLIWEPSEGPAQSWTFKEFADEVDHYAAGFKQAGVNKGDFITIHLDNCPEFLFAWHACVCLGAVAVTTNTRSSDEELSYFIKHSKSRFAITSPTYLKQVTGAAEKLEWIACTGSEFSVDHKRRTRSFASLRADTPLTVMPDVADSDINSVQYTSGSTSRPKGVVWTHANALWGASVNATHLKLTPEDTSLIYMPLFHTNALAYSMLASLWAAATIVLLPKFSASRFWPLSLKYKCTWASVIPFHVNALKSVPAPDGQHSYRFWGGVCNHMPEVWDRWAVQSVGWWGMTETITHGMLGSFDYSFPNPAGSVGMPATEYGVRVVDTDGAPVKRGETGRLLIRGVPGLSLFLEYLNDFKATAESYDDDGWFLTGDLVLFNVDGSISFSDREKDMLKVGGENVAASEVERAIYIVPGVKECAVVAKPHEALDQVPVAFVICDIPEQDASAKIVAACTAKLASFKVPREIYIVDELPRVTLNKIDKKTLRQRLLDM